MSNNNRRRSNIRIFTDDECFRIIAEVEKREYIWNDAAPLYKNRKLMQIGWQQLADLMDIPREEIIIKWSLLRQRFRNAFSKAAKLKREGQEPKPTNKFYDAMFFMAPTFSDPDEELPDRYVSTVSSQSPTPSSVSSLAPVHKEEEVLDLDPLSPAPSDTSSLAMVQDVEVLDIVDATASSSSHRREPPPSRPPPPKRRKKPNLDDDHELDTNALKKRLSKWLDDEESSSRNRPINKYESLATFVANLLRDHPNRAVADEVAVEMMKLATKLLIDQPSNVYKN